MENRYSRKLYVIHVCATFQLNFRYRDNLLENISLLGTFVYNTLVLFLKRKTKGCNFRKIHLFILNLKLSVCRVSPENRKFEITFTKLQDLLFKQIYYIHNK